MYARNFGISDKDVMEAPWLKNWIKNNHNRLKYDFVNFKFWYM